MRLTLQPSTVRLGEPMLVQARVDAPGVYGTQRVVTSNSGSGRGTLDVWRVEPSDGLQDPSVYWGDHGNPKPDHLVAKPDSPVEFGLRLDDAIRFTKPGTYAVQVTTVRGKERIRSKPVRVKVEAGGDVGARKKGLFEAIEKGGRDRARHYADLGLLGGEDVITRAVEGLGDRSNGRLWALVLHLVPEHEAALTAVEATYSVPDLALTVNHFEAASALCYNREIPWPASLSDSKDASNRKADLERKVRQNTLAVCQAAVAKKVAAVVMQKSDDEARARTLGLLLDRGVLPETAPEWLPEIATAAAEMVTTAPADLVGRWLTDPNLMSVLPSDSLIPALVLRADRDADRASDQALIRLDALARPKALVVAGRRYGRAVPIALDEAEPILLESSPEPRELKIMATQLHLLDARGLRLAAGQATSADAAAWSKLYRALPEDVGTDKLAAVTSGLLNTGHSDARTALTRVGVAHPDLLVLAASSTRNRRPLIDHAFRTLSAPQLAVSFAAGTVIAEHGVLQDRDRLLRLVSRIDGEAEVGLVTALMTARAWMVDRATTDRFGPTLQFQIAAEMAKKYDYADHDVFVVTATEYRGAPAIKYQERRYVGEEAIVAKLRQLRPTVGLKFSFLGISALDNLTKFSGYGVDAGVRLITPR